MATLGQDVDVRGEALDLRFRLKGDKGEACLVVAHKRVVDGESGGVQVERPVLLEGDFGPRFS